MRLRRATRGGRCRISGRCRSIRRLGRVKKRAEAFLTGLAQRDVAAAAQNQALNAIAFLYKDVLGTPLGTVDALRVRRPATVREALSIEETRALLSAMPEVADATACLVVRLLYGCGLRVSEPLELRIKDVDLAGARLTIRGNRAQESKTDKLTGSRRRSCAHVRRGGRLRW